MLRLLALTATLAGVSALLNSALATQPPSSNPSLVIHAGEQNIAYKRSELLKRPDVGALHVEHDPSYDGKPRDYAHAVPLRPLFEKVHIPEGAALLFSCLDGFSAPLAKDRLLGGPGDAGSVPYLAIEADEDHWPKTSGGKDAGPFYLVWKDPEKSRIGTEEWPFSLASFVVQDSLEAAYPKLMPDAKLPSASPVRRGLKVFAKNCFACHTLNRAGQSRMGPDLNVPMSPTEYLSEADLRKLVRNPQALRAWPESKMKGFSEAELSEADLSDLIAYLKHMAKTRK